MFWLWYQYTKINYFYIKATSIKKDIKNYNTEHQILSNKGNERCVGLYKEK